MNLGNSPSLAPQYMAMIPAEKLSEIQTKYLEDLGKLGKDPNALEFKDRRFMGEAWQNPWSKALVSTYLLNSRYLNELVQAVQTDNKTRQRIEFATNQMI
ncbi:MAG: class I poly(R)-hydroxyalkanoic acid synthase, partial [Burkholderiaceae bacterium]|nr:class I poly(R)-hydroxyalkanoic acid synthase [Burkholderiaceae bacterium]